MKPFISIIVPTYNGALFIAGAIESVLAQSYTNWELLIISDGSTDHTKDIVESFAKNDTRIIFIENDHNLGIQKTLNKGIALAKGTYIARLDDDDRWIDAEKLSLQVIYFEAHTEHVLVGTNALVIDTAGKTLSKNTMPLSDEAIRSKILSMNCFLHATMMIKKSALEKSGIYNDNKKFLHAEDYELWLRLGREGKMANLPTYTTALTARASSLTSSNRILQAHNVLRAAWLYKKQYPYIYRGITISLLRYLGFIAITIIPLPQSWLYKVQRIYRSV
jgi:glycosyltransferase involved in cell wall biosynthesis